MSHYLLLPFGSGGDVNPFIWLGKLLQARGHGVTLLTVPQFREAVTRAGLPFIGVGNEADYNAFLSHPDLWRPIRGTAAVFDIAGRSVEPIYRAILEQLKLQPATLVAPFHNVAARIAREKTGARLVTVHLQPAAMLSAYDLPVMLNGFAWTKQLPLWLRQFVLSLPNPGDLKMLPHLRPLLKAEGITPPRRIMPTWMHSPDANLALFPEWFAAPQPDWPAQFTQVGFPLEDLQGEYELPEDLRLFLEDGAPPVLLSPGTGNSQGEKFFREGLAACAQLGLRALLGTRYAGHLPQTLPSWAKTFDYVPFSRLLPHVSVLVHHGGIGTMSQAFAAGVPQLVMPMAHDQPDNAERLQRLGAGTWLSPRDFKAGKVAAALRKLLELSSIRAACRELQRKTADHSASESALKTLENR
jgi:rhamnosyltransferase subunit B